MRSSEQIVDDEPVQTIPGVMGCIPGEALTTYKLRMVYKQTSNSCIVGHPSCIQALLFIVQGDMQSLCFVLYSTSLRCVWGGGGGDLRLLAVQTDLHTRSLVGSGS